MKLKEFFHHQKHTFLTDNEKFLLYQKIVAQRDIKKSFLQRYAFAKRIAYASFVLFFVFAVYGIHLVRDDIRYVTNSLVVQRGSELVQAGYIANIVQFDGSFIIEHNGRPIQTSVIRDGDVVSLRPGTHMTFHIDDQTKAQIIGPAQFVLQTQEDKEDAYTIELLQGDFVEIQSLQEQTTQDISLISKDVIVHQQKTDSASHFQLMREGQEQRVENKGADVRVVHTDTEQDIAISARQTLNVASNDITLIDQETQTARVLMQRDVTQTIAFVDIQEEKSEDKEISVDDLSSAFEATDVVVDEEVVSSVISTIDQDDKRVVSPEQNSQLRGSLHADTLSNDMQSIYKSYLQGDEQALAISMTNLNNTIASLHTAFDVAYTTPRESSVQSFVQTISTIRSFVAAIEQGYYMPPRYVHNLETLIQGLEALSQQEFGSQKIVDIEGDEKKKIIQHNLRFQ